MPPGLQPVAEAERKALLDQLLDFMEFAGGWNWRCAGRICGVRVAGTSSQTYAVRLRQATLDDVEVLRLWWSSGLYTGEFSDFGAITRPPVEESIKKNGLVSEHGGTLIVERVADHKPIGTVS